MNSASIFDLSPSEKLQLVEDLWDDLAAASEAVPVHDWQKQELAPRKAHLLKNPASYEGRRAGLGEEFLSSVDAGLRGARDLPSARGTRSYMYKNRRVVVTTDGSGTVPSPQVRIRRGHRGRFRAVHHEPDRAQERTDGEAIHGGRQFSSDVMPERVRPASLRNPAAQQRRRGRWSRARAGRYPRLLLRFGLLAALAGRQEQVGVDAVLPRVQIVVAAPRGV